MGMVGAQPGLVRRPRVELPRSWYYPACRKRVCGGEVEEDKGRMNVDRKRLDFGW